MTNYEMTMGAVIGLNERGVRFPDDISLVGYDNLEFAKACSPKLTIVSQPTTQIGAEVAGIMLRRLSDSGKESGPPMVVRLAPRLIEGASVRSI